MKVGIAVGQTAAVLAILLCSLALGGCRKEEQDRVLLYEQGEYQGQPDDKLQQAEIEELRSRARRQQF